MPSLSSNRNVIGVVVRSARLALVALASVLAAGCDDATGPPPALDVGISVVRVEPPVLIDLPQGIAQIECTVELRAIASGTGAAEWLGAMVRFYVGEEGEPPIDSTAISPDDVGGFWGDEEIEGDSAQFSRLTFSGPVPFAVEIEYGYEPDGGRPAKSATVEFACGPTVSPDVPLPVVQTIEATAVGGALEPGGDIDITFSATAPAGLWQSLVRLAGDCPQQVLFPERLATTVTRSLRLTIPASCGPGAVVTVSVFVQDAGLREAGLSLVQPLVVEDRTPPSIVPVLLSPYLPNQPQPLEGTFFQGDTIGIRFGAQDNDRIAWLIWEISPFGVRDSVAVPPGSAPPDVFIPLRDGWTGGFDLRLFARDPAGSEATRRSAPNALRVLPSLAPAVVADTIQGDVVDLAIDAPRDRIYVLQRLQPRLAVLALSTLQPVATVTLPATPGAMDLTPSGDSLLVTLLGRPSIGVIDLRQAPLALTELTLTLDPALEQFGDGIAAMAGGRTLITLRSSQGIGGNRMFEVDLRTGTQRERADVSSDGIVGGVEIERSADGMRAALVSAGGFRRYDLTTDTFGPEVSSGFTGPTLSLDATGSRVVRGLTVFDDALAFLRTVASPIGGPAPATQLSPSGTRLYHAWPFAGVVASSAVDGTIEHRLLPVVAAQLMRLSPDERTLVAAAAVAGGQSVIIRYPLP